MTERLELPEAQKRAARLASRADIHDVRLFSTAATLVRSPEPGSPLGYSLSSDATVEYDNGDSFVVRVKYQLAIVAASSDEEADPFSDPSAAVANIEFEQGGLFVLEMREGDDPVQAEELDAFAVTIGQFAIYPFAREYIYDVTGRLALPPLTIGVLRLPMARGE